MLTISSSTVTLSRFVSGFNRTPLAGPDALASFSCAKRTPAVLAARKGTPWKGSFFFFSFSNPFFVAAPMLAAAESQAWKVRPGDNLDIIAATLEIPKEEIKKHNPEISETNLQVGQKLKLPLALMAKVRRWKNN